MTYIQKYIQYTEHKKRSLVKCGIAECGMRKVKYGIEKCGNGCGMVGKMRNAEKVKWALNLRIIQYLDQLNVNMTTTTALRSQLSPCDGIYKAILGYLSLGDYR